MSLIAGTSTPQHLFSQELDKVRKEARERAIAAVRREKTFIVRQKANILKEKATGENSKDNGVKIEQVNENCNLIKAEQTEDENNPLAIATSKDSISPTQIQNELQQALITSSSQPFTTKGPISPATVDDGQKYKGLKSAGKRKRGDDSVSQDKGLFLDSSQRPSVSEGRRIRALQNNQEKRNIGVGTNLYVYNAHLPLNAQFVEIAANTIRETANLPALVTQPNVSSTSRMPRVINRGHLAALQYTTVLIKRAREAVTAKVNSNGAMLNLRKRLNDMEVWDFVDEQLVARSKVFDQSSLYGVTFDLEFPWDIRRDAERLLSKWDSKDFNTDLMRGVETRRGTNKNSLEFKIRSLEKAFPMVKANYHGQGNLYNGQWWPLQICTIRDGAHGSFEGGIYGKPGAGTSFVSILFGGAKANLDTLGRYVLDCPQFRWLQGH